MSGYVKLHRKIFENPLFKTNHDARHLMMDLLADQALAWADTVQNWKGKPVVVKRGQAMISIREMSARYGFSHQRIRTLIKSMVAHSILEINTLPNQGPSLVTLCKYEEYQDQQHTPNTPINTHPTHTQHIKEEVKELKELEKKESSDLLADEVAEAFDAYNATAAECGLPQAAKLTADRRAKIKARLKDYGSDGWKKAMANIEKSGFLTGANDRKWKADLDFVLKPASFGKIHDGGFGNGRHRSATADAKASGKSLFEMVDRNGVRL